MSLPNFCIIGAARSGTTSLYHYLGQHPQIFMSPVKEPSFFAFDDDNVFTDDYYAKLLAGCVRREDAYRGLFRPAAGARAIGEASPNYLYSPIAAARLRRAIPNVKLVAILRDPVERAWSHYLLRVQAGSEKRPFADLVGQEMERLDDVWGGPWHFVRHGFYHRQLLRYLDAFEPHQVSVHLYEDLQADPHRLLRRLFDFLDVEVEFTPDVSYRFQLTRPSGNRLLRGLVGSRTLRRAVRPFLPARLRWRLSTQLALRMLSKPAVDTSVKEHLRETYREDTLRLQDLIGRDLSNWLGDGPGLGTSPDSARDVGRTRDHEDRTALRPIRTDEAQRPQHDRGFQR